MTAEFRRLGKRGAYRLGQLRAQGVRQPGLPRQLRPRFARHRPHHWSTFTWLVGLVAGILVIAGAAQLRWWFVPFVAGVAFAVANRAGDWPWRVAVPAVALMAAVGWAAPLLFASRRGQSQGEVTRVIAALTGLPQHAAASLALTVAVAVVQAVIGYLLGCAITLLPAAGLFRRLRV